MSHKGYGLEHELEAYFLKLTGRTITDPILDSNGKIQRTFRVPASGAMSSLKGDIRTAVPFLAHQWLVEAKHRRTKSKQGSRTTPVYHLDMRLVHKNIGEAEAIGFVPVFVFSFKGSPRNRIQAIFRYIDYVSLVQPLNPKFVIDMKAIEFKQNKTTLTIRKDVLDQWCSAPLKFIIGEDWYALTAWDCVDNILKALAFKAGV